MSEQVRVEDSEVFAMLRAAMLKFAQAADNALSNADTQISRTQMWLENEQTTHWQNQFRRRGEAVTKAREAVRQKKLYKDASGRTPSAAEEEKALSNCLKALEEAQQKLDAIRRWRPRLEKESDLCRGGVSRLRRTLSDDIPRAVALLDRLALSVEAYEQIEVPVTAAPESAALSGPQETISRGGDAAPGAGAPSAASKPKEERHVADGQ